MFTFLKSIVVVIVTLLLTALSINAQEIYRCSDIDAANLISGIRSGNDGVMRSCVYYAGKHEVKETSDELIKLLKAKKDPFDLVLIAMAVMKIGEKEAMLELIDFVNKLESGRVKNIIGAIVFEYLVENDIKYSLKK